MKKFSLKNIKNSSVYVTPNFEHLETKRYKFSIPTLFLYLSVYTSIILLTLLLIFFFTPLKNLFLILENEKIAAQSERIENLEEKITFLTNEIEVFASSNRRMKYAIMLATNDSLDTTSSVYDSLKSDEVEKLHPEGDILSIAEVLFNKLCVSNQGAKEEYFLSPINNAKIINYFDENSGHLGYDFASKIGTPISAIGEGGEFESLVLDCPLFKKKIKIEKAEILEENKNTARLLIKKVKLKNE